MPQPMYKTKETKEIKNEPIILNLLFNIQTLGRYLKGKMLEYS